MKRKAMIKCALFIMFSSILVATLFGCATTPNMPFQGSGYPICFSQLTLENPLLARELSKLPELRDGISEKEAIALEIIAKLYQHEPNVFDSAFKQMYNIGLPNVRKYCSPLQAVFWLAEDNEINIYTNPFVDYSLNKLLDKAWKFYDSSTISEAQTTDIVNGIKSEKMKEDYLARRERLTTSAFQILIIEAYKNNKYAFKNEARKVIETIIDSRWEEFDVVTDRLNAPELIDYYERKRFRYVNWTNLPKPPISPAYVFTHNVGECVAITGFTTYCLSKAGYWAMEIRLPGTNAPFHAVCLFEMNGIKYVMDNGRPVGLGFFPYESIKFHLR